MTIIYNMKPILNISEKLINDKKGRKHVIGELDLDNRSITENMQYYWQSKRDTVDGKTSKLYLTNEIMTFSTNTQYDTKHYTIRLSFSGSDQGRETGKQNTPWINPKTSMIIDQVNSLKTYRK